jgi:hypothetical protein
MGRTFTNLRVYFLYMSQSGVRSHSDLNVRYTSRDEPIRWP